MMGDAVIRRAKRLTSAQICTDNSAEAPKLHASSVYLGLGPIVLLPQFSRHNPLPVPSERTGGAEMMRYLAAALVVLAAPVSADPIGDGSALVQENCARCHGVTAEDHSPNPRAIPFVTARLSPPA